MSTEFNIKHHLSREFNSPQFLRAKEWLEAGNFRLAVLQLSQLVKNDPEDPLYWKTYADALEKFAKSSNKVRQGTDGNATSSDVVWGYALNARKKALEKASDNPRAWGQLAGTLIRMRQYDKALEALEEKLQLDPENIIGYGLKAQALMGLHRYDEALEALEEKLQLDPEDIIGYGQKAQALMGLHRYDEALEALEEKLQLDPEDIIGYGQKAQALMGLDRYDEALEAIGIARKRDPGNIKTQLLEVRLKEWASAKEHSRDFWEQDGMSPGDEILDIYDEYQIDNQEPSSTNGRASSRKR